MELFDIYQSFGLTRPVFDRGEAVLEPSLIHISEPTRPH